MAAHVLVVASVTAASDDLLAALQERERTSAVPVDFRLVMPSQSSSREADEQRLAEALERWREAGLTSEGTVGDRDPVQAVAEICRPGRFDEVIVSTLPGQTSRWLRWDVPYRIGALTDPPLTHVGAISMLRPTPRGAPLPPRERAPLGLLNVMAYRGARSQHVSR